MPLHKSQVSRTCPITRSLSHHCVKDSVAFLEVTGRLQLSSRVEGRRLKVDVEGWCWRLDLAKRMKNTFENTSTMKICHSGRQSINMNNNRVWYNISLHHPLSFDHKTDNFQKETAILSSARYIRLPRPRVLKHTNTHQQCVSPSLQSPCVCLL